MKRIDLSFTERLTETANGITTVWQAWRHQRLPLYLFILLSFNLIVAPAVYAATGDISRTQAYALGVLVLTTLALSIYLFVVMFQPERF